MKTEPLSPTLWRSCRVLANERRQRIMETLFRHVSLQVKEVMGLCGLSEPQASLHLRALSSRGLLRADRLGPTVSYRAVPDASVPQAEPLLAAVRASIRRGDALDVRLKAFTAFTHPRRLAIATALAAGPLTAEMLHARCRMSLASAYLHLGKLQRRGVVVCASPAWRLNPEVKGLARDLLRLALGTHG